MGRKAHKVSFVNVEPRTPAKLRDLGSLRPRGSMLAREGFDLSYQVRWELYSLSERHRFSESVIKVERY